MSGKYSPFQLGDIVTFITQFDRDGICVKKGCDCIIDRLDFDDEGNGPLTVGVLVNGHHVTRVPLAFVEHKKKINTPKARSTQVGGDHYRNMKIQPVEFITANAIPYLEGNVIKYICRHRSKGGAEDLKKAKHYIDLLLQHEYPEEKE